MPCLYMNHVCANIIEYDRCEGHQGWSSGEENSRNKIFPVICFWRCERKQMGWRSDRTVQCRRGDSDKSQDQSGYHRSAQAIYVPWIHPQAHVYRVFSLRLLYDYMISVADDVSDDNAIIVCGSDEEVCVQMTGGPRSGLGANPFYRIDNWNTC